MSLSLAIHHDDRIFVASDRGYMSKDHSIDYGQPKSCIKKNMIISFSGSSSLGQIFMSSRFTPPKHPAGMTSYEYMIGPFVRQMKASVEEDMGSALMDEEDEVELMVVYMGDVFTIDESFCVSKSTSRFCAIGSGTLYAQAILHYKFTKDILLSDIDTVGIKALIHDCFEVINYLTSDVSASDIEFNTLVRKKKMFGRETFKVEKGFYTVK